MAVPALGGTLLVNRLLVLAVAGALLALAGRRMESARAGVPRVDTTPPPIPAPGRIAPTFDRWTGWRQAGARLRLEVREMVATPVFVALLLLGVANALAALSPLRHTGSAAVIVRTLAAAFQLTPIVIALFFAGEARWREREGGLGPLIGATPMTAAAFLLPKFLSLALVLVAALATAAGAAAVLLLGAANPAGAAALSEWLLAASYDALTFASLTLFLQAIAPNKLAGWGFTVVYLIATLTFDRLGWTDPLYRYGRYPADGAAAFRLGWAAVAALLVTAATVLARRADREPS